MKKLGIKIVIFMTLHIVIFGGATRRLGYNYLDNLYSGPFAHFMAFFIITFSTSLILSNRHINFNNPLVYSFFYALLLSFSIEVIQKFLGYRTFSEKDILIGAIGSFSYLILGTLASHTKIGNKLIKFTTS